MKKMTEGTRRSTYPLFSTVNGIDHKQRLKRYTEIGYEIIAENGFSATLAYFPYGTAYVKIVTVEHGKITSSLKLTPKQLRVLSERVGMKFSTNKARQRPQATDTTEQARAEK